MWHRQAENPSETHRQPEIEARIRFVNESNYTHSTAEGLRGRGGCWVAAERCDNCYCTHVGYRYIYIYSESHLRDTQRFMVSAKREFPEIFATFPSGPLWFFA